jgi:hypothetical protein
LPGDLLPGRVGWLRAWIEVITAVAFAGNLGLVPAIDIFLSQKKAPHECPRHKRILPRIRRDVCGHDESSVAHKGVGRLVASFGNLAHRYGSPPSSVI